MKTVKAFFVACVVATAVGATESSASGADRRIDEAVDLYASASSMPRDSRERAGLLTRAESLLNSVIDDEPGSLEAHRKLMGVYLLQQDYANAIRTLQDAITLSPDDPKLFVALALLYDHSGSADHAVAMLERALEIDPRHDLASKYHASLRNKLAARRTDSAHRGAGLGVDEHPPVRTGH